MSKIISCFGYIYSIGNYYNFLMIIFLQRGVWVVAVASIRSENVSIDVSNEISSFLFFS